MKHHYLLADGQIGNGVKPPFMGDALTTSIPLSVSKTFIFPTLIWKEMWSITCSTRYKHSLFFYYLSIESRCFYSSLITATGGWTAGRQRVTLYYDDVMKWKSVCLIVLKMRLDPCLGCICLVAGKWAVSQESYLVASASAGNWRNDPKAFGYGVSIWSAAGAASHVYTWLSITEPISWAPQGSHTRETVS